MMKNKKYIIFVLSLILMTTIIGCGLDEQSQKCIDKIKNGLQDRWSFTEQSYNSYDEFKKNIEQGIDAELSSVEEFKNIKFNDEKFDDCIKDYIKALESQKEGIGYIFKDAEKYNDLYLVNGSEVRSKCLKQLVGSYDLDVDAEYKDTFEEVLKGNEISFVTPGKQVKVETKYGKIGVSFIGFDILTNPADKNELVLYCEIENFSYYDEYNGESLLVDYFLGVYDGAGYNIECKSESYDYIDGYEEVAGVVELRRGEKGKFAISFDYSEDIDIVYAVVGGKEESFGCYLTSNEWKSKNNVNVSAELDTNDEDEIDYSVVREQMSNFGCNGMYNIYDGWVYSINYPEDGGRGFLAKMRTDGTEYTVLSKKGIPQYISVDGEFIYTVLNDDSSAKIYRCRLGGNDLTQLVKDNATYLQVTENCIYYNKYDISSGKTLGFFKANKDGSNEELILDKEIYYSYVIGNILYYQDDNDKETMHKYNLNTKKDEKITNEYSYCWVIDGEYGYYVKNDKSVEENDYSGSIVKVDLKSKKETVLYEGASTAGIVIDNISIYFINSNDSNRIYNIGKDGKGVKLVSQDTNCINLAIFGDKLMYMDFDNKYEFVDAIYLCEPDGSNKIRISKNQ